MSEIDKAIEFMKHEKEEYHWEDHYRKYYELGAEALEEKQQREQRFENCEEFKNLIMNDKDISQICPNCKYGAKHGRVCKTCKPYTKLITISTNWEAKP